jgi:hypothetical protein
VACVADRWRTLEIGTDWRDFWVRVGVDAGGPHPQPGISMAQDVPVYGNKIIVNFSLVSSSAVSALSTQSQPASMAVTSLPLASFVCQV